MISNRDLVTNFSFTPGQVKTWAVLVLGRDPLADQAGGVRRKYDLDSAFKIFFCGFLVKKYRMGLKQAANHLNCLWVHLEDRKLLPSFNTIEKLYYKKLLGVDLYIYEADKSYQLKWRKEEIYSGNYGDLVTETYKQDWLTSKHYVEMQKDKSGAVYIIPLNLLLDVFLEQL